MLVISLLRAGGQRGAQSGNCNYPNEVTNANFIKIIARWAGEKESEGGEVRRQLERDERGSQTLKTNQTFKYTSTAAAAAAELKVSARG